MIDKMKSRPVLAIEGIEPVITSKHTYIAPFENAEIPNDCPLFHKTKFYMTDRDIVNSLERICYKEGLLVVTDPESITPHTFIDEIITHRLPN